MWAFLSRRVRRYALLAVAVPVAGWIAEQVSEELERRHGETRATRAVRSGRDWLRGRERGPLAGRQRPGRTPTAEHDRPA